MIVILFRIFLLIAVGIIVFSITKYFIDPRRKLEAAHRQGSFYLLDETENVRRNLLFTYRHAMFQGEKFLGPDDDSFDITSIMVWTEEPGQLHQFRRRDFKFIEKELLLRYPKAEIEWRNPLRDLLKRLERNGK